MLNTTLDKQQIINEYVIANERRLKNLCRKLYSHRYLADDLFQELYITMCEIPQQRIDRYPGKIGHLFYYTAISLFRQRNNKRSALKEIPTVELWDTILQQPEEFGVDNEEMLQAIEEAVNSKVNSPHDFLHVSVFLQSEEQSYSEISRRTRINRHDIAQIAEQGREDLKQAVYNILDPIIVSVKNI